MLLLKNGKIFTMNDSGVIYGDVLIKDGKIKEIGKNLFRDEAKVIDLKHNIVMPGLIDSHSSLGLIENGIGFAGNDLNEKNNSVTPQLKVKDGVNILDRSFEEAVKSGITSALICPGPEAIVAGQCSVFKTYGKNIEEMNYKKFAALQINLGDKVKNFNKAEMPMSRMGVSYMIRKLFLKGKQYINKNKKALHGNYNPKYESLRPILSSEVPVIFYADKLEDILTAIRIKDEFGLDIILQSCTEGYFIIEELKKRNIPVLLGPYLTDYSNFELVNRDYKTPNILSQANMLTTITTNHPDIPIDLLAVNCAIAVKKGMDYGEALKTITINPAKILGIDERVGSIEEGKDADIAVFNGDPLKIKTKTLLTIIDGKVVYES